MASLTAKIQNLIDYIGKDERDEKKEESLPSTSTIDASNIKIVVLGCGLVVPPLIEYLNFYGYQIIIGTRSISKADPIIKKVTNPQLIRVEQLDITGKHCDAILDRLCKEATIIISLLPYIYHVRVAKYALKYEKHFCTTSYISDEMLSLNDSVKQKNLLFLNECGVDPGLDHMSAQKIIDNVQRNGGQIKEFYSICGGLPAPECNDNPFGYKFSWAPKGVLLASKNCAKQLIDREIIDIPGIELFGPTNVFSAKLAPIGNLEWYYNRDSVKYIDIYGLKDISTMIRGTYRYPGWCQTMKAIADLQLVSDKRSQTHNKSYAQYFSQYLNVSNLTELAAKLNKSVTDVAVKNLDWIGLFSQEQINAHSDSKEEQAPIDVLCKMCLRKLKYSKGEKDMLILKHRFECIYPANGWRETVESVMLDFGLQPNDNSSMARTVSLPLAIAIRALIEDRIDTSEINGVIRPVYPPLYNTILSEIDDLGIKFTERTLPPLLWLRDEVKPGERRVIITPNNAQKLLNTGFRIVIEESKTRCISDNEYAKIGCKVVKSGSWVKDAPYSAFIVGTKELPDTVPNACKRRHIFFAHAYKGQNEAIPLLRRFKRGKGEILDLEYLVTEKGRRVAAFGRSAGMVGMAMGIIVWCKQILSGANNIENSAMNPWKSEKDMIASCIALMKQAIPKSKYKAAPKVIIIGALGRCGGGSSYIAKACKLTEITEWDLEETKAGGPFETIVKDHDIFVNCIRLADDKMAINPFITLDLCKSSQRRLSVVSDVACDPNNPNNPVRIYDKITTMFEPIRRVIGQSQTPLDITAIDHLPSLIPFEASQQYSDDLIATLLELKNRDAKVWQRARKVFLENVAKV